MANIELRFKCSVDENDYITVNACNDNHIEITTAAGDDFKDIILDIPTAIKFAKTLRTEINKAKEDQNETN